jgi:hypothetical protein
VRRALAVLVVIVACSEPKVAEDSAAACSNHKDDDGDGLIDCDDPDCFSTDACERNDRTCSNDIDDDDNGVLDCQQESCRSLAICKDPVETACQLRPTAAGSGCPRGKGCYITPDNRRWCALEGPSLAGGACGNSDPSDRSQGCAAGYLCVAGNRCARICSRDYDCTRSSICRSIGIVSTCTTSCRSDADCHANEECIALQRTGLALEDGGWAHQCIARADAPPDGSAKAGEPCSASQVCMSGFLCIPEPSGSFCRSECRANTDGSVSRGGCPNGTACYAVVPFSAQDTRFDETDTVGVCL